MVQHPAQYEWSSHRVNAGLSSDNLISPHRLYFRLGEDDTQRKQAYRELFGAPMGDHDLRAIRDAVNGGYALGRPSYLEEMTKRLTRRVSAGVGGRPKKNRTGVETVV
jgi:putative transposase